MGPPSLKKVMYTVTESGAIYSLCLLALALSLAIGGENPGSTKAMKLPDAGPAFVGYRLRDYLPGGWYRADNDHNSHLDRQQRAPPAIARVYSAVLAQACRQRQIGQDMRFNVIHFPSTASRSC
ncbi:hypothetical protein EYR36_011632 [Pleurotus pulmonarius]|nr:hypothetical protein EYR36_011632 [Pleurotus pulmonarius]